MPPGLDLLGPCDGACQRRRQRPGRFQCELHRHPRARAERVVHEVDGDRLFEERFGSEKLRSGGELTSVASGLALRAGAGTVLRN